LTTHALKLSKPRVSFVSGEDHPPTQPVALRWGAAIAPGQQHEAAILLMPSALL
jgi:hypothetical protein